MTSVPAPSSSASPALAAATDIDGVAARQAARRLGEEVQHVANLVADQCDELEKRLGGAKLSVLQKSITARAQALTPIYRANVLHRARTLQKARLALVQQLHMSAQSLAAGRDVALSAAALPRNTTVSSPATSTSAAASANFPNFSAVLATVYAAMEAEQPLTTYTQPLRPTQPAFSAFVQKICSSEHDLPRRLAALNARKQAAMGNTKLGGSASTDAVALEDDVSAVVEEGLALLLDCLETQPTHPHHARHRHAESHKPTKAPVRTGAHCSAEHPHREVHSVESDEDVSFGENKVGGKDADITIVENEEEEREDDGDVVVEADDAHGVDADVRLINTAAKPMAPALTLRWPVLLSLEQYCMDMPEPVHEAQARHQTRVAIQKAGKQLNAESQRRLSSTIGFYFLALGSTTSTQTPVPSTAPSKPSMSMGYGASEDGEDGRDSGDTLKLSEKERVVAALTHTVLRSVNSAWEHLRVAPSLLGTPDERATPTIHNSGATTTMNALEDVIDVIRLRYVVELVAMVVATWSAVPLIMESDEGRFFDLSETREVRLCTLSPPTTTVQAAAASAAGRPTSPFSGTTADRLLRATVPAKILCLPSLDNLFFCLSYCLGVALAHDIRCWLPSAPSTAANEEEEDGDSSPSSWSSCFATAFLGFDMSAASTNLTAAKTPTRRAHDVTQWWRVWLYLWDCVLVVVDDEDGQKEKAKGDPTHTDKGSDQRVKARLSRHCARRWVEYLLVAWKQRALADTPLLVCAVPRGQARSHETTHEASLEANAADLNVEAVLGVGRSAVTALWDNQV